MKQAGQAGGLGMQRRATRKATVGSTRRFLPSSLETTWKKKRKREAHAEVGLAAGRGVGRPGMESVRAMESNTSRR